MKSWQRTLSALAAALVLAAASAAAVRTSAAQDVPAPDVKVTPKAPACREVCRNERQCTTTYVERCVDGACFNFPRQTCQTVRVCQTVCN